MIEYKNCLGGIGLLTFLTLAGGLMWGLSSQPFVFKEQLFIVGLTSVALGAIGILGLCFYTYFPRAGMHAAQVFQADTSKSRIWTYIRHEGSLKVLVKNRIGAVAVSTLEEAQKYVLDPYYIRVVISPISRRSTPV